MEKNVFLREYDFNTWYNTCAKSVYMDGRKPKKIPMFSYMGGSYRAKFI